MFRMFIRATFMLAALFWLTPPGYCQEPPFTWKGEGAVVIVNEDSVKKVPIKATISVDADMKASGAFATNDGEAKIVRWHYEDSIRGDRRIVVLLTDANEESPKLVILVGRTINDRLFYGEAFVKALNPDGEIEKELDLKRNYIEELYTDDLPATLKKAVKACKPIGAFALEGRFENEANG